MHVNLIAGGSGYPYWRFLVFDVAGTLSWLMLYGGLGYVLGSQAEVVSQAIASYSGWLVGAVLVGIAVYLLVRHLRQPKRADAVSTCAAERA
jgi:membrane protein DedA with SNARE-associated domain